MSPIRVEPASPGCCILSLLLLPFNIILFPFRILISPSRPRYPRRWL
jgi:hypothetical protein